ncbi:hypothetical protein JOD97_000655 [Duganella sp. 1411]|uniref:hypothetical protein n=1 Tax=Duganella sp. 1411 TaxID=2806572 RepID=UPI001AE1B678|nr:hypothetical protein [Duganella sp. 1411]MBP1202641.1 hypothetical protein [Duganella sp. 1411]
MDEIIYDLLLKSPQGFMLLGTLRFRVTEFEAAKGTADVSALLAESLERPFINMDVQRLEGSIAVQFLSGLRPVPIEGLAFSFGMVPLPLNALFNSADPARPLTIQFSFLDATHIGGGMIWQVGTARELKFSLLGTQRGFGM